MKSLSDTTLLKQDFTSYKANADKFMEEIRRMMSKMFKSKIELPNLIKDEFPIPTRQENKTEPKFEQKSPEPIKEPVNIPVKQLQIDLHKTSSANPQREISHAVIDNLEKDITRLDHLIEDLTNQMQQLEGALNSRMTFKDAD